MEVNNPGAIASGPPNAKAVRRFWIAWLVFLLALLVGLIAIILIAAVAADPGPISPAG